MSDLTTVTVDVSTPRGILRGVQRAGSAAFLGIPFAEAPIGALRFQAPVATGKWDGIRDATSYGATPQRQTLSEITLIPEPSIAGSSTLNLNVFTPDPGTDERLPVLVWIHGGGFIAGSPASPWYDGAAFNRDGVVTVSVSYRLGFDGFGWIADAPANRGVLDWVLALEWVRENIASFGGDPERVTVAGQSAGGGAALTLLAVPRAASLFNQVISLSGAVSNVTMAAAEETGRKLAELGGVEPTVAGLGSLTEDQILMLQASVSSVGQPDPDHPFAGIVALVDSGLNLGPVIDGETISLPVDEALGLGSGRAKPLMLGTTDHEFNFMVGDQEQAMSSVDPASLLSQFAVSSDLVESYLNAHPGLSTAKVVGQFVTDSIFRSKTLRYAEIRDEAGNPVFLYRFSWISPTMGGAVHCLDVPFFFDCLDRDGVAYIAGDGPPATLADDVHDAAVAFITSADPGFAAYTDSNRAVRVYDSPSRVESDAYADAGLLKRN